MRVFFLDTNIFLQCRPIHELPWAEVAERQDVTLLIPRAVQEEIDRLKHDGNSRRARRARAASSLFRQIVFAPSEALTIRERAPRVEVSFSGPRRSQRPCPDGLDPSRADDQIIWDLLIYAEEIGAGTVMLLTDDINIMLTAKAHAVPVLPIPDAWLLPPEPDERDKRIAELDRRLKRHEEAAPRIVLSVTDATGELIEAARIAVTRYEDLPREQTERVVQAAMARYPMITDFSSPARLASFMPPAVGFHWQPPAPDEVEQYRQDYAAWEERLREFLSRYPRVLEQATRRTGLVLTLENAGGAPAANLVVELEAQDGILFDPPRADEAKTRKARGDAGLRMPPSPPRGKWVHAGVVGQLGFLDAARQAELSVQGIVQRLGTPMFPDHLPPDIFIPRMPEPRDRHAFYWKRGKPSQLADTWALECGEFRHQVHAESLEVSLFFPRGATGTNAGVQCTVTASNLVEPLRQVIPVRIEQVGGDAEAKCLSLINGL
jgi:hypothetical protein